MSPAVAQTLAKAESTNNLIDQALKALEPYKNDNTLGGSIELSRAYRGGTYDPIATAAAQLSDLAGLQTSSQAQLTSGASRALRYYTDRRQHVPRLPSGRQIDASTIAGPTATSHVSQWMKGDEGGFDSPSLMYQKLVAAKANNQSFIDELNTAMRTPAKSEMKPEPGAAAPQPGQPPPPPSQRIRPAASHGPGGGGGASAVVPGLHVDLTTGKLVAAPAGQ